MASQNRSNGISIATKLTVSCFLMVIPIAILIYYLVTEKNVLIQFTEQEVLGVKYMPVAQEAINLWTSPERSRESAEKAAAALTDGAKDVVRSAVAADASAVAEKLKSGSDKDLHDAALLAVNLLTSIADTSNITLDPDMDGYYIGDLVVNQLPGLAYKANYLIQEAADYDADKSNDHLTAFIETRSQIATAAGNFTTELAKAFTGNPDGSLKAKLSEDGKLLDATMQKYLDAAKTDNREALRIANAELQKELKVFIAKATSEEERLLKKRSNTFRSEIKKRVAISLVVALISLLMVFMISRRISSLIGALTQSAFALAKCDYSLPIRGMDRSDELGGMARSLTSIRETFSDFSGQIQAIGKSQAVIEFGLDGSVLTANANFLQTTGYTQAEIKGQKHSMFMEASAADNSVYKQFWANLNKGNYEAGEYKILGKHKKEIWVQASYNPILDPDGKVFKIAMYATEVSKQKLMNADFSGQIAAIGKSQAVIEFNMAGEAMGANANFLQTFGYSMAEITGKHHSFFLDEEARNSGEYAEFWGALKRGEYRSGEYLRMGKDGKEIWVQASYNPILDLNGVPYKIVEYATDITSMVRMRLENEHGMNEAIQVLSHVAAGDLSHKMEGNYVGTFSNIKQSLNDTIQKLELCFNESVLVLSGVSSGDLTRRMENEYVGVFEKIKLALNSTVDKLIGTVRKIKESALLVNSAANEIAAGSSDLSMRTEQQASSLEETAASMEELTGTVKTNSQNASSACELSTKASNIATAGGAVIEEVITAMDSIEKSSKKISDIIGTIDEIAFQTNLLALNAAVEAARAGDAGKGFAVVAAEVRALAGRSASASKEIKSLISESASQVDRGVGHVERAGETFKGIVGSVKEVAKIVSDISSASTNQASGIEEVNAAVRQMDEGTQQNAALVEEYTAAVHSMLEQAKMLENMIAFFKIEDQTEASDTAVQDVPASMPLSAVSGSKPISADKKQRKVLTAQAAPIPRISGLRSNLSVITSKTSAKKPGADDWEEF